MSNRSSFPNSIDTFIEHTDISYSDIPLVQQYTDLKLKENKTSDDINTLNQLTQTLRDKILSPEDFNLLQDAITNLENFTKNTLTTYYQYRGVYSSAITYNIFNTVMYNGNIYMALQDNISNVTPTSDPTKWLQISAQGAKGDKGDKGDPGANLVFKGMYDNSASYNVNDLVGYIDNNLYYCINASSGGNPPTNSLYWTKFMSNGSQAQYVSIADASGVFAATNVEDALTELYNTKVSKNGDTIKPSADSTTVFQVQKSDGSVVLDVDTTNKRVGIQTNSPDQPLTVAGNIKTTNQFISTVTTGTAPLQVSSTTVNTNFNSDMTDGIHFRVYNGSLQYNDGTGWKNIMASVIKSIQRGVIESTTTGNINITINAVNINKAVVITSGDGIGYDTSYNEHVNYYAVLTGSTTLTIKQRKFDNGVNVWGDTGDVSLAWQVIEYV